MGATDGGKCHQHVLAAYRELGRTGLPGGHADFFPVAVAELLQGTPLQDQGLVRMAGDNPLPADHIGHPVCTQVDAADDIIERVIFINTHDIQRGLSSFLYRHPHGDAQLALKDGRGVRGQIVRLLKEREKAAVQLRRRTVPLEQLSVQAVQRDGIQLVDLRSLHQERIPVSPGRRSVGPDRLRLRVNTAGCLHPGVPGDGHHPVRQHVDIGLHCFG